MKILSGKYLTRHFGPYQKIIKRWLTEETPMFDCGPDLSDRGVCTIDPCDPLKCHQQPRVVIIGAGMAGLSAAARLSERGINNFTILEAYERPGGRIQTSWLGDAVAELGAYWDPGYKHDNLIYTMSVTDSPPCIKGTEHSRTLFHRIVPEKLDITPTIAAYHKFRKIEKEAALIFGLGDSKQHGSLNNFMSLRIQQELHEYPEEHQHEAARIMFGLLHMFRARSGGDTEMLYGDHEGYFMNMPGGKVRIPLGCVGVLAPLLRQVPEGAIRYCKPVNCIYWGTCPNSGCRAVVCTTDGEQFPTDYVIITVSVGVLCANTAKLFCPELPASKVDVLRCLGCGYCNKIYLEYSRPFWYWHNGTLDFKFSSNQFCDCCDWTSGIVSIKTVPHSKRVLSALVLGDGARMLESACDVDICVGFTEVLKKATGNGVLPYPVNILRSSWISDPFFQGAYSFENGCSYGQIQRALACPLPGPYESIPPILLFAGEATVPGHYATVVGARISGIREADRIVQLTKLYKGPPAPTHIK